MAKRKAAGTTRRKSARKSSGAGRKRAAARKTVGRKVAAKKTARKKKTTARKTGTVARTRSAAAKGAQRMRGRRAVKQARRRVAKKAVAARKPVARKAVARKAVARKPVASKPVERRTGSPKGASSARSARTVVTRKAPALDRARRTVQEDDDIVPTPPSSLDLNRTASAARTGRRELSKRLDEHTESGPALTAGDVDADWEGAYSVGDEAPGGDNPTPDQDVVDDIGKAVGVQYEDNEELKGEAKIAKRDKHRWELDPASAEDYDEH
jgi:hypothetical protein